MTEAARKKKKDSNMSKTSDVRVKEKVFNSRKGAISNVSKSAPQEALKSKVRIRICINSRYVGYKIFF
jgi:hypothetical protein